LYESSSSANYDYYNSGNYVSCIIFTSDKLSCNIQYDIDTSIVNKITATVKSSGVIDGSLLKGDYSMSYPYCYNYNSYGNSSCGVACFTDFSVSFEPKNNKTKIYNLPTVDGCECFGGSSLDLGTSIGFFNTSSYSSEMYFSARSLLDEDIGISCSAHLYSYSSSTSIYCNSFSKDNQTCSGSKDTGYSYTKSSSYSYYPSPTYSNYPSPTYTYPPEAGMMMDSVLASIQGQAVPNEVYILIAKINEQMQQVAVLNTQLKKLLQKYEVEV
jgi:hypothetical protein